MGINRISQRVDQVSTGDISDVTAGNGLSGGGSSGAISLALDVNELVAVTAVAGDYVAIEDVGDGTSKKALISDITALAGDITGITTAATSGLNGGGTTGALTLVVDASRLTALGATVATTDYVVIYDTDAAATKKVLVSNMPGLWG